MGPKATRGREASPLPRKKPKSTVKKTPHVSPACNELALPFIPRQPQMPGGIKRACKKSGTHAHDRAPTIRSSGRRSTCVLVTPPRGARGGQEPCFLSRKRAPPRSSPPTQSPTAGQAAPAPASVLQPSRLHSLRPRSEPPAPPAAAGPSDQGQLASPPSGADEQKKQAKEFAALTAFYEARAFTCLGF